MILQPGLTVKYPDVYLQVSRKFDMVNLNFVSLASAACVVKTNYYNTLFAMTMAPIALSGVIFLYYICVRIYIMAQKLAQGHKEIVHETRSISSETRSLLRRALCVPLYITDAQVPLIPRTGQHGQLPSSTLVSPVPFLVYLFGHGIQQNSALNFGPVATNFRPLPSAFMGALEARRT